MRSEAGLSRAAVVAEGAATLRDARIPEARREALRIWADLAGEALGTASAEPELPVPEHRAAAFDSAIRRRAAGEPLAHVTGVVGVRHLTLR